ncbi:MAG: hypothetical protein ACI9GH_000629 [Candidatus Paceibacteria bacterium]|jgi:hypothetical protein
MIKILVKQPVLVNQVVFLENNLPITIQQFLPVGLYELEEKEDPEFPEVECALWYFIRDTDIGHYVKVWEEYKSKNLIQEKL